MNEKERRKQMTSQNQICFNAIFVMYIYNIWSYNITLESHRTDISLLRTVFLRCIYGHPLN